ncbi:MAG TPA: amidohydrolase family protein [bacterium]|nr:amidohydrolase family protein [bacterium]
MVDLPICDAHQHFWDPRRNYHPWLCDEPPIAFRYGDYRALRRPYLPADYRRDSAGHRIVCSVYVEAEWDSRDPLGETRWVTALAEAEGLPSAVVAQAWLDRDDVAEVLAGQAGFRIVRGVRHKPVAARTTGDARRGAPGSMDDPRWRAGYALLERHGLSFDLQTPWWHLKAAAELARDFPGTQMILNHTGLPADRSAEGLAAWRLALETLAAQPNVALKISGLGQPGQPWTVEANGPIVRDAIAIFGVARCMFASNFPVDSLVASFDTIFTGFGAIVAKRPEAEQRALFHDNAVRIYRLAE